MLYLGKFQSPHTWSAMNVGEGIVRGTVGPGTRWRQRGVEGRIRPYQKEKESGRGDQVQSFCNSIKPQESHDCTKLSGAPSHSAKACSFLLRQMQQTVCYDCNITTIPSIRATLIITDQMFTVLPVVLSRKSWWSVSTMGDVAVPPSTLPGVT